MSFQIPYQFDFTPTALHYNVLSKCDTNSINHSKICQNATNYLNNFFKSFQLFKKVDQDKYHQDETADMADYDN